MHLLIVSENFRIILSKSNLNISLIYLPQNGWSSSVLFLLHLIVGQMAILKILTRPCITKVGRLGYVDSTIELIVAPIQAPLGP